MIEAMDAGVGGLARMRDEAGVPSICWGGVASGEVRTVGEATLRAPVPRVE